MAFEQQWREQAHHWIAECVQLAQANPDGELESVLAAVAVLWPLREPVQQFDLEVIAAVHQQAGGGSKFVLRQVQAWDDGDLLKTARRLRRDLAQNPDLLGAVNRLLEQFGAKAEFDRLAAAGQPTPASAVAAAQSRVFISYARSDGETEAHHLRQRLEAEGIAVWQDRVKMVGGRDWWLQITEALDQVEFLLLVATRGALQSEVVHKEWRYARQQGVCVLPIQVQADLPEELIPRWMRRAHFYNIEQEWSRLIENLNTPCQTPRVPHMVEELPDGFVSRPQLLDQVAAQLVSASGEPVAATVALHGLGGYGKTLLARSVCHSDAIRQGFDDGILWMTLGETPGDLTERVVDLIEVLTGERPAFAGLDAAETRLAQLLGERNFLLVIDDVWQASHLAPFLQGGPCCGRIITTRNLSTLPPQAQPIEVGPMTQPEATALLGRGLPAGPEKPLHDLAERLAYWPLLLGLVNGTLRDRVNNDNQPLADALVYVNKALDKRGLTAFDAVNTGARDQAVSHTLGMSRDLLLPDELARFNELAIFPPYAAIPLGTLAVFWGATGGLDAAAIEALCQRLFQLSLLARFDIPSQTIKVHSILRNYLTTEHAAQLPALHQKFLDAFAQNLPAWAALPHANGYLWNHLAYHLVNAGRSDELVSTVKDLSYLAHKTFLRSANAAEADLLAARRVAPADAVLAKLHLAFSQSSHLLAECKSLAEVAGTLHSRLAFAPQLAPLATAAEVGLPRPLLTAGQPLPDLPAASLLRAFAGHNTAALGCDIDDAGASVVSIDRAAQVKVWDARTGAERLTLAGHQTLGNCCAISGNGAVVVSAAWDGALNVWDAATGELRHALSAHEAPIYACAISADGSVILSASKDKTVKIWDGVTGALRFTLSGHERTVTGCSLNADGALAASCALDGTVKLWHTASGQLQATLTAYELRDYSPVADLTFTSTASSLLSCALSADGRTLVSTLPNGALKVWDVPTGAERCLLRGHTGWVENCAVSADGRLLVSAGNDKTLKGWDGVTGDLLFTLKGHLRAVAACAINADGTIIASASHDRSVRLWDARASQEPVATEVYSSPTQACASSASLLAFGVAEESVQLLEIATQQPGPLLSGHQRPILGCAVGRRLAVTASQDHSLKIWDAATGRQLHSLGGHAWAVNDCALTPDETRVVSASDDSTLKIWDTATGAELRTLAGHIRGVNGCAVSPDGAFVVSAAADETLKIWDLSTGAERLTLAGHTGPVNQCAVSPDGGLIASASRDGTLKIWRSQNGAEVITLTGHTGFVTGCAFHPGGEFLLSVSRDETIKLWRIGTGQGVASLRVSGGLHNCAWASDGRLALVAGARGVYFLRVIW